MLWRYDGYNKNDISKMTQKLFIEYEVVSAGQPRAYADSIYEGYLTFSVPEGQSWASRPGKDYVKRAAYGLVREFSFAEKREWHENYLKTLEEVSPNKWHVIIISPYLD